jgi:hypothetical protein
MGSRLRILLLAAVLSVSSAASFADMRTVEPPSAAAMAADMLLVRPLGVLGTVVGTGLFVVSLPLSALGMNSEEAVQRLVAEPARFTFVRPLGDFNERGRR